MSALAPGTSAILTPGMSKKAFMETLLAPPTLANDHFYSKEKSSEVFVQGHSDISVTVSAVERVYVSRDSVCLSGV